MYRFYMSPTHISKCSKIKNPIFFAKCYEFKDMHQKLIWNAYQTLEPEWRLRSRVWDPGQLDPASLAMMLSTNCRGQSLSWGTKWWQGEGTQCLSRPKRAAGETKKPLIDSEFELFLSNKAFLDKGENYQHEKWLWKEKNSHLTPKDKPSYISDQKKDVRPP